MENEQQSPIIVTMTIEGTPYENVEVSISDLDRPIREQIERITEVLHLPKANVIDLPIEYELVKTKGSHEDSFVVFEPEDENGKELSLRDYNIKSGDHLHCIRGPIPNSRSLTNELQPRKKPHTYKIDLLFTQILITIINKRNKRHE